MKTRNLCMKKVCLLPLACCFQQGFANTEFLPAYHQPNEQTVAQQTKEITGIVTDAATGEPIIGASVVVKGTTTGVPTDFDGKFSIKCAPNSLLVISYIGYEPKEVKVGKQPLIHVELTEDSKSLQEVVVTAFGSGQKKESIVGSIQTVKPGELKVPSANLSNSFAGRLAGVIAFQRSGQPGADGSNFYIRGVSTMSGVTNPLIILDGVEVSSGDLNALDPEVIEGFSILKDATATAMYGTRGANGVMIVTTKSGGDFERPIINLRVEGSISSPTTKTSFVDGPTYMRMYNEAATNQSQGSKLYTQDQILGTQNGLNQYIYPNVDWYDELFKSNAFNQNVNFNIRGGGKRITYFMNVGVNHQEGMLRDRASEFFSYNNNINVMRYAFQNNLDFNLSKTSRLSLHMNTQLKDTRSPKNDVSAIYGSVMNTNPVNFPVMYPAPGIEAGGNNWIYWGAYAGGNDQGATNPLAEMVAGYKDSFESTVIANLDFEQKLDIITEGLKFKALASFKNWSASYTTRSQGYNRYTVDNYTQNEDGSFDYVLRNLSAENAPVLSTEGSTAGDRRIYLQAYFDYTRNFGDHYVNAMALYNQDQYNNNVVSGDNSNEKLMKSLPKRRQGFAGRLSYDYDHRYMLEVNVGYNGSENFAKGHRWGLFPSVAVGYNISEEDFFAPLTEVVSSLKIRGSYGKVGNDQIGDDRFIYMSIVDLQSKGFTTGYGNNTTDKSGPAYTRYQNNNITWEIGKKLNVGIDMMLFRSLSINIDGFQEIRSNIFQQKQTIPNYLGTAESKVYGNYAKVKNWGFDGSVDYAKQIGRDWTVQMKGTFTFARNKVLEYDEAVNLYPNLQMVGNRLNVNYGYIANNLFIDWADVYNNPKQTLSNNVSPGDIKYTDVPNRYGECDGQIDDNDRVAMGHPTIPEIVYGFGPSIRWKNLDFSCFFQGVGNSSLMMSGFHPFGTQYNRNVLSFIGDSYWSPTNQDIYASYPRLTQIDHANNTRASSYWLRDASFLKLKNAEIGYTYRNMRIYASGANLLTFSKFKHWDPEQGGGSGLSYPTQRVFNVGFQMTIK